MTTSGVLGTELEVRSILEHAYSLAGLEAQKLGVGHAIRGRETLNLIFGDWTNRQSFPWKQDLVTLPLVQGSASYVLNTASAVGDNSTVDILDMVWVPTGGNAVPMTRIALNDYLNIPNKTDQGRPDRFWLRRDLAAPTLFVWQAPDATSAALQFYRMKALFDITASQQTLDMVTRWYMAVVKRLAYELMPHITPMDKRGADYQNERSVLRGEYKDAFEAAAEEDRDKAPTAIYPDGWNAPSLWGG